MSPYIGRESDFSFIPETVNVSNTLRVQTAIELGAGNNTTLTSSSGGRLAVEGAGLGLITAVSNTAPASPLVGDQWFDRASGRTFIYYDNLQWIDSSPVGPSSLTIPTASADVLGGIRVGSNLSVANGVLNAVDTLPPGTIGYFPKLTTAQANTPQGLVGMYYPGWIKGGTLLSAPPPSWANLPWTLGTMVAALAEGSVSVPRASITPTASSVLDIRFPTFANDGITNGSHENQVWHSQFGQANGGDGNPWLQFELATPVAVKYVVIYISTSTSYGIGNGNGLSIYGTNDPSAAATYTSNPSTSAQWIPLYNSSPPAMSAGLSYPAANIFDISTNVLPFKYYRAQERAMYTYAVVNEMTLYTTLSVATQYIVPNQNSWGVPTDISIANSLYQQKWDMYVKL